MQEFDRQWDIRFNLLDDNYLQEIIANVVEHYHNGGIKYVLIGGVEIGTRPEQTDYQVEHIHVALILQERMTAQAILKKWKINTALGYYMKPRNRDLPYDGWKTHHIKEFSKKDPNSLSLLELGELPTGKRKATITLRSDNEKKMKTDEVILDMRRLIEEGKQDEAFTKYPRNYMMYGEKIKAMINQKKKSFFGKNLDPHLYVFGFPGSGKTSVLKFVYPNMYKKDLSNRFFDLYNDEVHTHIMLEDLDSVTLDKLSVQWFKTICDEAGFAIDQKYKTPQPTRSVILVTSNQNIDSLINGLDDNRCVDETKKAIKRRFLQLRIDELLRILGIKLIPEYDRKQLKKQGNDDPSLLFMAWNYSLDAPTGIPIKTPEQYQQMIRDFYFQ